MNELQTSIITTLSESEIKDYGSQKSKWYESEPKTGYYSETTEEREERVKSAQIAEMKSIMAAVNEMYREPEFVTKPVLVKKEEKTLWQLIVEWAKQKFDKIANMYSK
jgi:hypothetical protein